MLEQLGKDESSSHMKSVHAFLPILWCADKEELENYKFNTLRFTIHNTFSNIIVHNISGITGKYY